MCLRNWGKPTISNKEIKVIGRFKVRLLKYVVTQQMSPRADNFFNFTLVCTQSEDFFSKFKGHNSVKNYRIWAIYERMEGWKRATQYAPANLRWEYNKIYNLLHSSCLFVEWWKSWSFFENPHIKCDGWRDWMERLDGETELGWGMKDTL